MFQGAGFQSLRKRAEAQTAPTHCRDLVGYDTVQGRPLSTVTQGFHVEPRPTLNMVSPAVPQITPFSVFKPGQ